MTSTEVAYKYGVSVSLVHHRGMEFSIKLFHVGAHLVCLWRCCAGAIVCRSSYRTEKEGALCSHFLGSCASSLWQRCSYCLSHFLHDYQYCKCNNANQPDQISLFSPLHYRLSPPCCFWVVVQSSTTSLECTQLLYASCYLWVLLYILYLVVSRQHLCLITREWLLDHESNYSNVNMILL